MVALLSLVAIRAQAQTGNIQFSDNLVKSLCVEAWDTNHNGELSYQEAAAVTDLGLVFKGSNIERFNELQHFSSLHTIHEEAFRGCANLKEIHLPNAVEIVERYAFHSCNNLTDIILNNGLKTIGNGAFTTCSKLVAITLPTSITALENNVFYQCSSLQTVNIPNGLTNLPARLFYGCSSLRSILVPNSVVNMSPSVFEGCESLNEVTMPVVLPADYLPQSVSLLHLMYQPSTEYSVLCSPNRLSFAEIDNISAYVVHSFSQRHLEIMQVNDVAASTGILVHAKPGRQYEVFLSTVGASSPQHNDAHRAPRFRWNGDAVTDSLSHAADGNYDLYTGPNYLVGTNNNITVPSVQNQMQNFFFQYKGGHYVFTAVAPTADISAHSAYLRLPYFDVVGVSEMVLPFDSSEEENNIYFLDAETKRVCVEAWDTNGDGELSFDEAAAVENLGLRFKDNKNVKLFNELKHFTSLTQINSEAFKGCSSLTTVMLPSEVRYIGADAFYGCFALSSLVFNDKLHAISSNAFTSCTSLTNVELPASVRIIGSRAFYYCTGLTGISIPEGVLEINSYTFSECRSLTSIKLPNSVETLDETAFKNCNNLHTVIIPAHIRADLIPATVQNVQLCIKLSANVTTYCSPNSIDFSLDDNIKAYSANSLRGASVYLNQVFDMPANTGMVLRGTSGTEYLLGLGTDVPLEDGNMLVGNLEPIVLEPDSTSDHINLTLKMIGTKATFVPVDTIINLRKNRAYLRLSSEQMGVNTAFRANFVNKGGIHFNDPVVEQICLRQWDANRDGVITYEEAASVTNLGNHFQGDTSIRSFMELEYFTGVKQIPDSAFSGCINLSAIMLPPGILTIGKRAFSSCYGIVELELPDSIVSIGDGAFSVCTKLSSISLPESALDLGTHLFNYCPSLTEVHLPKRLTAITDYMFNLCKQLPSIYIPPYVKSVGLGAFSSCTSLTSIKKPATLSDTNIPDVEDLQYYHILSNNWETFSSVNAVDFTHSQEMEAYAVDDYNEGVVYLRKVGDIPAGTGVILHGPVGKEVVLGKGKAKEPIENMLVGTVTSKEIWPYWADYYNYILSSVNNGVVFLPVTNTLYTEPNSAYLAVPTNKADSSQILNVVAEDIIVFADRFVKQECVSRWDTNSDGELSVSEAAAVTDIDVFSSNHEIRSFDELRYFTGVTSLCTAAFQNCTSLRRISIPATVKEIGNYAFDGCYSLEDIFIPEGTLERVGIQAFSSCTSLTHVQLPATVTYIGESTFSFCTSLQSVNIPDGVTEIGPNTFASCMELPSIYIPCSVKNLDETAFIDCSSLNTVTLPALLPSILPEMVSNTYYIHRINNDYETFCSPYNLVIPDNCGLLAFTIPSCDGNRVLTSRIDSLTAGTGVLVSGEKGRVFTLNQGKPVVSSDVNLLVGVLTTTEVRPVMDGKVVYCLQNLSHGYGFYRITMAGNINPYRSYLLVDQSVVGNNSFLEIGMLPDIDDPVIKSRRRLTSGSMETDMLGTTNDVWHTLTGVRLQSRPTQSGLYIHNGKKVTVK